MPADRERRAADDAVQDDRGPAVAIEPVAPVDDARAEHDGDHERADVIWFGVEARISSWSGNGGFGRWNWNSDWLNHRPMAALTAIHVGARSQTCECGSSASSGGAGRASRCDRLGLAGRVLDAAAVDRERDDVEDAR